METAENSKKGAASQTSPDIGSDSGNKANKEEGNSYFKKYRFLKENGYFDPPDKKARIQGRYTGDMVRELLHGNKHIILEVTDACNLKCKYCGYGEFYSGYDQRENRFLSFEKAKALLDYMTPYWNSPKNQYFNKEIRIGFYGGEPLLNFPFIEKVVQYAQRIPLKYNSFSFGMTTNGVLLDKHIDYLVKNNFHTLISLDGDREGNGFRVLHNGKPGFDAIYKNVCLVRDKYPDYFEKYVNFSAVLNRLNSVEKIYDFFKSRFDKVPGISEISPFGIKDSMREAFAKVHVNMVDSFSEASTRVKCETNLSLRGERVRRLAEMLYFYSDNTFKSLKELMPASPKPRIPTGTCIPLNRKIFLNVNGKLLPCERVSSSHVLGTVGQEGVRVDFEEIARKYNLYFKRLNDQCLRCYSTVKCPNCVLNMNIEKDRYKCPDFTSRGQLQKYLSESMEFLEENPELYKKIVKEYFLE
jgi:uncharacterized protein